jgi:hypothetical protein
LDEQNDLGCIGVDIGNHRTRRAASSIDGFDTEPT